MAAAYGPRSLAACSRGFGGPLRRDAGDVIEQMADSEADESSKLAAQGAAASGGR